MCWQCDNPDATIEDYLELVRSTIDNYGWFIQAVGGDRHHPPFSYTVGLTEYGHPELLLNGRPWRHAQQVLNNIAHNVLFHDGPMEAGEVFPTSDGRHMEVVQISEPTAHVYTAINMYGPAVTAQQLVYSDDRGRWPWEVGFRGRQRVFGPRATEAA